MNAPAYIIKPAEPTQVLGSLEIPILNGVFSASESHESVLQLLLDLQRYHRKRNFSYEERFGKPDPLSEQILTSLDEAITSTKGIIKDAGSKDAPLALESSIKIAFSQ